MTNQSNPVVRELADVFHDREEALLLLQRSDFPMSRLPDFTTPLSFWSTVAEKACNGVLPGGIQRVIDMAARLYPENSMFRAMGSWELTTARRLMNPTIDPRLRVASASDEQARALVHGHVDARTAKAPIGRWAAVVMSINSALTAFSGGVLLYAFSLAPPSTSQPEPQGCPCQGKDIQTQLLADRMEPEEPDPETSSRSTSHKRGKSVPRETNEGKKGANPKRDLDDVPPGRDRATSKNERVPVPVPHSPKVKESLKVRLEKWQRTRKKEKQKRKAQRREAEEEELGPRTEHALRASSLNGLVCG